MPRRRQASQVPVPLLQATHLRRLDTRPPRRALAALVSVLHLQATRLLALSIRLHHRATRPPRLHMALLPRHRTLRPHPATHRHRPPTRLPRQATVQLRLRIVELRRHTTARRHLRTVRRRLLTARRAHNSVRTMTGARPPRPHHRHIALPARSTLLQAPLETQRTRLPRPSSPLPPRVRHHTRRLRRNGRQQARPIRLRKFHQS